MQAPRFGYCVPTFALTDLDPVAVVEAAVEAEHLGFDSIWVPDHLSDLVDDWLVGTPDEVIRQIDVYRDLAVSHVLLWFVDYPSMRGPRLFAEQVLPALQGAF